MRRVALSLLALAAACDTSQVTVRVTIPDLTGTETPLGGVVVTFLPYNRDSVIAALEARGPGPRPYVRELDSLYRLLRGPFTEFVRLSAITERLRQERENAGPAPAAQTRLAQVNDSLAALEPILERARNDLDAARARYWKPIDSIKAAVTVWRNATYGGYDTVVRQLPGRRLANPVADTTDPSGWATIELPNGRWWVTARSIDPADPNAEWYWNLRIDRDTLLLTSRTGRNRPRY